MIPSPSDANAAWLSSAAKEACLLAISSGFSAGVQNDLQTLRAIAQEYTNTGFVDRNSVESCLERLRAAGRAARPASLKR